MILSWVFAQHPTVDSLNARLIQLPDGRDKAQTLYQLADVLDDMGEPSSDSIALLALQHAKLVQDSLTVAQTYVLMGVRAYHSFHDSLAAMYQDSAIQISLSLADTVGLIKAYSNKALVMRRQAKCEKASELYIQGIDLARQINRQDLSRIIKVNYANMLYSCNQFEQTIEVGHELVHEAKKAGDSTFLYYGYDIIEQGWYQLENKDSAMKYMLICSAIAEDLENPFFLSATLNNLGLLFLYDFKLYKKADSFFTASYEMDIALGNEKAGANYHINKGVIFSMTDRHEEAIPYFEKGIELVDKYQEDIFLEAIYRDMAKSYMEVGQAKKAAHYMQKSLILKDSVLRADIQKRLQELNTKRQRTEMQATINKTKLANQQRENILRQWLILILSGSAILLLAFLYTMSVVRRKRVETEGRRVELEYAVLRAQMNPHFIFNSLNSIQGFFAENDFSKGNEFLGSFSQLIRRVMDQATYEKISLRDELDTLEIYLKLEELRLQDQMSYEFTFEEGIEDEEIMIPPLCIQPFVELAIWQGIVPSKRRGKVTIGGYEDYETGLFYCFIEDDGIGWTTENIHQDSLSDPLKGVEITRERLGQTGTLSIRQLKDEDGNIQGSRVELVIPLDED
ncbi:MAG: histidine kinase [Bacteroidota bacterium]